MMRAVEPVCQATNSRRLKLRKAKDIKRSHLESAPSSHGCSLESTDTVDVSFAGTGMFLFWLRKLSKIWRLQERQLDMVKCGRRFISSPRGSISSGLISWLSCILWMTMTWINESPQNCTKSYRKTWLSDMKLDHNLKSWFSKSKWIIIFCL